MKKLENGNHYVEDSDVSQATRPPKPRKKGKQGFASMDKVKAFAIQSKGGKEAQRRGTGHKWTSKEASKAGKIGGSLKRVKYEKPQV